ncbi:hypothetical protein C8Q74DRAFT_1212228, partial [Fomes fomentarius]
EKEIPVPMLALVGAAVHASLTEWKSGTHKPSPFSADSYLDAYNEHILLLNGIKQANLRAFHKMMHRLYVSARFMTLHTAAAPATNAGDALGHVDIANMDID